ncbi:MAG: cell division protein FtsL, partial [Deltaproteobacteria bacterium]|nr:cell division protein FtsL [Deltaproteobacteria bacterium]
APLTSRRPASFLVLVVLCSLVMTLGAMLYVWQRYNYIRLGFEVGALQREKERIEVRIEPLQVEAAYLARPERIEKLARETLLMRPPLPGQVIVVEP